MTTTNHNFTSFGLTSIMALGSSLFIPLSRRRLVPPHLRHRVDGMSTYKLEGYSVRRISGMIQDDERKWESDNKDLRR